MATSLTTFLCATSSPRKVASLNVKLVEPTERTANGQSFTLPLAEEIT